MKKEIRKNFLKKREQASKDDKDSKSNEILSQLLDLKEFKEAKRIKCYVSKDPEVDTHKLIIHVLKSKGSIIVPFVQGCMKCSEIKEFSQLTKGKYDILEPKQKTESKQEPDLIIIPGIAFDRKGNRIGFGQGYYDKFLSKTKAKKIALAYDFQIIKNIPIESHDISMDMIITNKEVIKCKE